MDRELLYGIISIAICAVGTFGLTCAVMAVLLPRLRKYKLNQPISEYAPVSHLGKSGTPTLGGLAFVIASTVVLALVLIPYLVMGRGKELLPLVFSFGLALANAFIGFIDDRSKLLKKRNQGLTAWQKFLLQLVFGALYIVLMVLFCDFETAIRIPYLNVTVDFGIFTYIIAILIITGMINSTNLTDGVDGLLSSTTAVVACFFLVLTLVRGNFLVATVPALLIGSVIAFLLYNAHPAKVFMGDTGSLFIGACLVGTAFMLGEPLILLIAGGIYVVETASVILQVFSCKLIRIGLRKKRFFLRTPIHHHFEDKGYSENQVVLSFTLVSVLFCFLAWLGVL